MNTLLDSPRLVAAALTIALVATASPLRSESNITSGGPAVTSPWELPGGHHPSPFGYLWDGYCYEAAAHRMHRRNNFMATPHSSSCDEDCGSDCCEGGSTHTVSYRHGRYVNESSTSIRAFQVAPAAVDAADDAEPPAPQAAEDAPIREPVYLAPVDSEDDQVDGGQSQRDPIIRFAPAAPGPDSRSNPLRPNRIPRNQIPPRN